MKPELEICQKKQAREAMTSAVSVAASPASSRPIATSVDRSADMRAARLARFG